jgi:hypothetical protein
VNSIQVKHSGESCRYYRERVRYCGLGREGENRDDERENGVGFKRRSALVDFDRWSISTQKYFWILQIALSAQRYFDTWETV